MRVLSLTFVMIASLIGSAANSQDSPLEITDPMLVLFRDCFDDAIRNQRLTKRGRQIEFLCTDEVAKNFFDQLPNYGVRTVSEDIPRSGEYRTRYFSSRGRGDQCWQRVGTADGSATSSYGCQLYFVAGPILQQ
jgi:hypothetical protein